MVLAWPNVTCQWRDVIHTPKSWDPGCGMSVARTDVISVPPKSWILTIAWRLPLTSTSCELAIGSRISREIESNPKYFTNRMISCRSGSKTRIEALTLIGYGLQEVKPGSGL